MADNARYVTVNPNNPAIIRYQDLCAGCGHCAAVCSEEICVTGHFRPGKYNEHICLGCGQCSAACPEQAIQIRSEIDLVKAAVKDPNKIVVFSTSPSTRVGLGDGFLETPGVFSEGKMVSALRRLGGDYVLDVTFTADLTIMEEGSELIRRIMTGNAPLPQFTSCCPAWIRYVETYHHELLTHISTAKSPIGMQGALIKTYFAKKKGIDPRKIVSVAVTPCTAKKAEIRRPELHDAADFSGIAGMRDNDYVLTCKELVRWMREEGIGYDELPEDTFDDIMGKGSGAGVIFGNTGGVMEAALRLAYEVLTGESPDSLLLDFTPVRGLKGVKDASVQIGDLTVKAAVIYGTANAEQFLQGHISGYHFIEVMTCPGGCISGAGQPQRDSYPPANATRLARMASLYQEDRNLPIRNSIDNPEIAEIYEEFLERPLGKTSEKLLHTKYYAR